MNPQRRRLLLAAGGAAAATLAGCGGEAGDGPGVRDVAALELHDVAALARPLDIEELGRAVRDWRGPLSIGGGRFSMGGQVAAPGSLHLDMRGMNRLLHLDPHARTVRVQAGMTWRDLQDHLDPHDLSVAIMQSYSSFTIGGSASVNCHGRYVGKGPVVNSIRALRLVDAAGRVVDCDRAREPDLFAAAIGGYGGLGAIAELELDVDVNTRIRRTMEFVPLAAYPQWFADTVLADPDAVLHNADLTPPDFAQPLAITWRRTGDALTEPARLVPRGLDYSHDQNLIWAASELPGGSLLRKQRQGSEVAEPAPVVWRNREASLDTASLEPRTRWMSTFVLQEYFVPAPRFHAFAARLATILAHGANTLNVSIRHSPADRTTLLRWAPTEVFCFVVYYKQRTNGFAETRVRTWTRELIDAALAEGGRYYLPYRLHASREQFRRAYPEAGAFAAAKRRWDPAGRWRNSLWNRYLNY